MEKQFILFDPVTTERKIVTYKLLAGMTGRTLSSLRDARKNRSKIRSLNCYILDLDTPISIYRELLSKEVIPDEVWRDIPDSRWQVSSYGRYRSSCRVQDKVIYRLPYLMGALSCMIKIRINGEGQQLIAHEKVVELFIGEVPKGHIIYHKDGNKANNRVDNLGFITRKELMQKQATPIRMKTITQIDEITGEVLAEYKSLSEAAAMNYTYPQQIRSAIKTERPSIGFIWMTEEMALERGVYDVC
ncbi:MAG: HNH endonuclease [Peptostreptococcaceae bacterium]